LFRWIGAKQVVETPSTMYCGVASFSARDMCTQIGDQEKMKIRNKYCKEYFLKNIVRSTITLFLDFL
jgi:hypothetical protein